METVPITIARLLLWQAVQQTIAKVITAMFFAQKKKVQRFLLLLLLAVSLVVGLAMRHADAFVAQPLAQTSSTKPSIVLVHGAGQTHLKLTKLNGQKAYFMYPTQK